MSHFSPGSVVPLLLPCSSLSSSSFSLCILFSVHLSYFSVLDFCCSSCSSGERYGVIVLLCFLQSLSFIAHQLPYSARVDSNCSILGTLTPSSSSVGRLSTFCPDPCFAVDILQCLSFLCFLPSLLPPTISLLLLSSCLLGLDNATLVLVLLPDLIPDMLHLFLSTSIDC